MGLSFKSSGTPASTVVESARIDRARSKIDFLKPGALEAFEALAANLKATAVEYEAVAAEFPLVYPVRQVTDEEHTAAISVLRKLHDKAAIAICTGADVAGSGMRRITTGILGLDYLLGGGPARGYIGQFKGGDSLGKTTTLLKICAETIRRGGRAAWVAAENFSAAWARRVGVPILFSPDELGGVSDDQREAMLQYNEVYAADARFDLIVGRSGNELLQFGVDAIQTNSYDVLVIDSMAVLRRMRHLDKKTVGDAVVGGEAALINDFCTRAAAAYNWVEQRSRKPEVRLRCTGCNAFFEKKGDHLKCTETGKKPVWDQTETRGVPPRTAALLINQIRAQGLDAGYYIPPDAPGGWGLKHGKGYDVYLTKAEPKLTTYEGRSFAYAELVQMEATKSKICPPHRQGVMGVGIADVPGLSRAGEFDLFVDLFGCKWRNDETIAGLGELAGVVKKSGGWYHIGEKALKGEEQVRSFLADPRNAHVVEILKATVHQWILSLE